MKKIYFIVFFFTEIFFTANSQNSNNFKNKKTMEKINIESIKDKFSTYKQYVKDGKICESKLTQTSKEYNELKGDTLITVIENYGRYTQIIRNVNSNFKNIKIYNKNLLLKREAGCFGEAIETINWPVTGLEIGISKEYDENGNLIKEINHDKNYPFSIDMLIEKMKNDYDIDLSVRNQEQPVTVWRFYENSEQVYCIKILLSTCLTGHQRFIKLDGATGKVISDKTVSLPKDRLINTNEETGRKIEKLDLDEFIENDPRFDNHNCKISVKGDTIRILKKMIWHTLLTSELQTALSKQ
jgi:hypothetical protein